jgi:hypothetical protein
VPTAVILVEGVSDQLAVEALAARRGRDLEQEGVAVVPIGGAGNIRRFLEELVPQGIRLAGLCDAAQERGFRQAGLERAGVFVCDADLEDELIRSLGTARVEQIVESQGELRRFLGTRGGRKIQYAPVLVGALDLAEVPQPLDGVLAHV